MDLLHMIDELDGLLRGAEDLGRAQLLLSKIRIAVQKQADEVSKLRVSEQEWSRKFQEFYKRTQQVKAALDHLQAQATPDGGRKRNGKHPRRNPKKT